MSLDNCQDGSDLSVSLFNAVFTPDNGSITVDVAAASSVQGAIVYDVALNVYGYKAMRKVIDPCEIDLLGLCPMKIGKLKQKFIANVDTATSQQIPSIAYTIPDIDAVIRVFLNKSNTGESVACVQASFSNGNTIDLPSIKWITAIVCCLGLLAAAFTAVIGNYSSGICLTTNTLSLIGYFQAQSMLCFTGIHLPPIVQSWTQNFVWSIGLIRMEWMQHFMTWYQRATGGQPTTLFATLKTTLVRVLKRSMHPSDPKVQIFQQENPQYSMGSYVVYGIQRVAFRANIELSNIFMTGLSNFCFLGVFTAIAVLVFRSILECFIRQNWMSIDQERFPNLRRGWLTVLKGTLLQVTLVGFPQMAFLCPWELTQVDSPAEVVLAVVFLCGTLATLGWASFKIVSLARYSESLDRWKFIYVQFRITASYYVIPMLAYAMMKGLVLSLGQQAGTLQSVALIFIEAVALLAVILLRPWMNKSTNSWNIASQVINLFNSILLLMVANVFGAPALVVSVVGIVLIFVNAVFSLSFMVLVILISTLVLWKQVFDHRCRTKDDDRASLLKSNFQNSTMLELDSLTATASPEPGSKSQHDDYTHSVPSIRPRYQDDCVLQASALQPLNMLSRSGAESSRSPVGTCLPLFPAIDQLEGYRINNSAPCSTRSQTTADSGQDQTPKSLEELPQNLPSSLIKKNMYRTVHSPWQRGIGYEQERS